MSIMPIEELLQDSTGALLLPYSTNLMRFILVRTPLMQQIGNVNK